MVGAWNVAILNPKWFANEVMHVPKGTKFDLEMGLSPTMQFRVKIGGLIFIPATDKVIIAMTDENEDIIKSADNAAIELHKILSHTPIDGIGYNFTYELENDESFSIAVDFSAKHNEKSYKKFNGTAMAASSMLHSVKIADEPGELNLTYKILEGKRSLVLNYHYPVGFNKEKVKGAIGKFYKNYQHSKLVSSELIVKEVK